MSESAGPSTFRLSAIGRAVHLLKHCCPLFIILVLLCSCARWTTQDSHNNIIRTIGIQDKSYYAALAEGCDVFLKLRPLDSDSLYISESTNLAVSVLPSIITNLNPNRVIYTTEWVSLELKDDCWINWGRDNAKTNFWKMTVNLHGKEKTVYEEPSTKYCLATFGLYNGTDELIATNRVLHRTGLEYAWKLTIYSREHKVRIKEVFELPERGVWTGTGDVPEGLTLVTNLVSPDERMCIKEYDLELRTGCAETEFIQPYQVAKNDPCGIYTISLFLNGQPIKKFTFQVVAGD